MTLLIVTVSLVAILFPLPTTLTEASAAWVAWHGKGIGVTGLSVITHVSKCDRDRRTIPQLMASQLGSAVADLSFPGQTLFEGFNFAQIALRNNAIRDIVITMPLSQLANPGRQDLRKQLFFRLAAGPLRLNRLRARLLRLEPILAAATVHQQPWAYKDHDYPGYDEVKTQHLMPELMAQGCPESLGQNHRFSEALYWNEYLRGDLASEYLDDLRLIAHEASDIGKRLVFVLLPIDFDDINSLEPHLATAIVERRDLFLAAAKRDGLNFLDLTELLPATDYSDRFCACGHLNELGREKVAAQIAAVLDRKN